MDNEKLNQSQEELCSSPGCGDCQGCQGCASAPQNTSKEPVEVVDILFREGGKVYFFSPGKLSLKAGDHVIMDTSRGPEFGIVAGGNHTVPACDVVQPLREVLRLATEADEKQNKENRKKEKDAFRVCQQKILEHKLDMQLVSAEYAFDGSKILFFFTAEGRVDFRELVKNLASVFHTRIELRQIGVRDKAKMVGGLGICGRPFCCKEFLDDFQPVSIKMAKTQNLSLNPTKISGTCGRLMCCLKYEQDAYEDLIKTAPKAESFVDTPDGRGTVTDVNLLRQSVKVRMEKAPDTVGTYKNDEIYVIRNGKAKKTDAPIPEDFAPISSQHRAPRRMQELEALPDVILSGEKLQKEEPAGEKKPTEGQHRSRRHGHRGERNPARAKETPAREQKPNKEQKPAQDGAQKPQGNRNRNHRRHRPRHKPSGDGNKA